jgi:hypothetical protein
VTRPRPGRSGVRVLIGARIFFLVQIVFGSHDHSAFYSVGIGVLCRDVKLALHLHLAPRLRISGVHLSYPCTPSWRGQRQLYLLSFTLIRFLALKYFEHDVVPPVTLKFQHRNIQIRYSVKELVSDISATVFCL